MPNEGMMNTTSIPKHLRAMFMVLQWDNKEGRWVIWYDEDEYYFLDAIKR
jgi:hypothetical protein